MKRILLSLMMAGGLAMLAAPMANATAPGECGKTYAILLNGAQESTTSQTGGAGLPGAVTSTVGVGTITFGAASGTGCSVTGGELIFNSGDIQTNPVGEITGPAHCYDAVSAFGTGIPCFDGAVHMTGTIAPSSNVGNSWQLSIVASYDWNTAAITSGSVPLGFTVQNNTADSIIVGTSNSTPGGQALTLTMQRIGSSTGSDPAVPAGFGTAPYLGDSSISCSGYGANNTDFVASSKAAGGAVGSYGSTVGALQIFNAAQAGGSLSFNSNDDFGSTTTPPGNNDCAFSDVPGNECSVALGTPCTPEPSAYGFADGASNSIAFIGSSGNDCADDQTAGSGYATSAVAWGATYSATYIVVTGLISGATGFVPPGIMSTCASYASAPAGTITIVTAPTTETVTAPYPATKSIPIKVTSTTPADCDIEATLTLETGLQSDCTATLSSSSFDVNGGTVSDTQTINCTCIARVDAGESDTYSLSYSSLSCPIHTGAGPVAIVCRNSPTGTGGGQPS